MEENLKKFFFQFYIKKCILQHQHLKQVRMYFCFYFIVFLKYVFTYNISFKQKMSVRGNQKTVRSS